MEDIPYDANANKMYSIEIVFIYTAPRTCSDHLCGQLQGDKEVKGDTVIVLFIKVSSLNLYPQYHLPEDGPHG
jgi:hypothetical protein